MQVDKDLQGCRLSRDTDLVQVSTIRTSVTPVSTAKLQKYEFQESRRMLRNVVVTSVAFMVLFTATSSMANLQSSLNPEAGLGTYARACNSGVTLLSSLFLPTFVIQHLTAKWTLVFGMFGPILAMAAQFHPTVETMIPASILSGIFYSPLWSAKCIYLTHVGQEYAELVGQKSEEVITKFFGIFFLIFQTSKLWGSFIASQVLTTDDSYNGTIKKDVSMCGIHFCPANANDDAIILKLPIWRVNTLVGIYIGLGCIAVAIAALCIDALKRYGEIRRKSLKAKIGIQLEPLIATFQQMTNPIQILVIPLTFWSGLAEGFYTADFYQAFVSCTWGVEHLGYIGICYGFCDAVGSYIFCEAAKYVGRTQVILFGAVLNMGLVLGLFYWNPDPESPWLFYVIAGLWGIADSIWQTQINALYGILFPVNKEAAFSNYRVWTSLGFIVAFLNSDLLCVSVKMYFLIGALITGMTGYFTVDFLLSRRKLLKIENGNTDKSIQFVIPALEEEGPQLKRY